MVDLPVPAKPTTSARSDSPVTWRNADSCSAPSVFACSHFALHDNRHAVSVPLRERRARLRHAVFHRDHLACRKTRASASVFAERDHLGQGLHGSHHGRELLGPVRIPVHQPRQITLRERRVMMRQRSQGQGRLGHEPIPVLPGQGAMLVHSLRVFASAFAPCSRRSDLMLRLQVESLLLQAAVVHRRVDAEFGKTMVDVLAPALAPARELRCAVPLPHLLAEPLRPDSPHAQHHVRVRLGRSVGREIPVHVKVRHHAARDELACHEISCQSDPILTLHLARDRKLHLARQLRVLALLSVLDLVPQCRAIVPTASAPPPAAGSPNAPPPSWP